MAKTLKCLWGPSHGRAVSLRYLERQVPDPLKMADATMQIGMETPQVVEVKATIYTVRDVHFPQGTIEYLAPQDMSDFEVMKLLVDAA